MTQIRSILIALPTVGRIMKSETAITVAKTVKALQAKGINTDIHNIDSAEIVTARDMFANMLLYSQKWDAMLFIDSDMGFSPQLILKMLRQRLDVVAAACPRRTLDLERFVVAAQAHGDLVKAASQASNFTVFFDWDDRKGKPLQVNDGFSTAAAVGMAVALISKAALQAMVDEKVVDPRLDLNARGGGKCWSFFGILEPDGHRLGEDYSFCYRWTKMMGRELRVCVDEEVAHVGDFEYRGTYADTL
jgi:hypothetical protein